MNHLERFLAAFLRWIASDDSGYLDEGYDLAPDEIAQALLLGLASDATESQWVLEFLRAGCPGLEDVEETLETLGVSSDLRGLARRS